MEKQQTAIEWLENEFQEMCKDFGGLHSDFIVKFNQAKAMEKEQIMDAYEKGDANGWNDAKYNVKPKHRRTEQYYNETFKTN